MDSIEDILFGDGDRPPLITEEGGDTPEAEQARQHWRPTDERSAEWCMAKMRAAERELARIGEQYKDWLAKLGTWFDRASAPHLSTHEYMAALLEEYGRERFEVALADAKGTWAKVREKSIPLPSGVIGARGGVKWHWDDDEVYLAWAREHAPNTIRITEAPDRAEIKKAVLAVNHGEFIEVCSKIDVSTGGPPEFIPGDIVPGVSAAWEMDVKVVPGAPDLEDVEPMPDYEGPEEPLPE